MYYVLGFVLGCVLGCVSDHLYWIICIRSPVSIITTSGSPGLGHEVQHVPEEAVLCVRVVPAPADAVHDGVPEADAPEVLSGGLLRAGHRDVVAQQDHRVHTEHRRVDAEQHRHGQRPMAHPYAFVERPVQVQRAVGNQQGARQRAAQQKRQEVPVVALAHTVVHPDAVVVMRQHTALAH